MSPEYINGFLIDPTTRKLVASYADAPRVLDLLGMMDLPKEEYNEYKKYMENRKFACDVIRLHHFQKSILQFLFINKYILQDEIEKEYYLELNKVCVPSEESIEDFLKSITKLYNIPN